MMTTIVEGTNGNSAKTLLTKKDHIIWSATTNQDMLKNILLILWHKLLISSTEYEALSAGLPKVIDKIVNAKQQPILILLTSSPAPKPITVKNHDTNEIVTLSTNNTLALVSDANVDNILVTLPSCILIEEVMKLFLNGKKHKAVKHFTDNTGENWNGTVYKGVDKINGKE